MRIDLKHWVLALAVCIGISGGTLLAAGAPFFQDHSPNREQDYSKNRRYQQGVREGQADHTRNRDHSKKRHFRKDEDQKGYEAGYQKGHGN
jgi:hypothetical protein